MECDNDSFYNYFVNKYYYLELSKLEFNKLVINNNFNSIEEINEYFKYLICLILNDNSISVIDINRNRLLVNFIEHELNYSDSIDDNLLQLKKLYIFYDMIMDKQIIMDINMKLINSNQKLMNILKNVFKYFLMLNTKDSYLMLLIDSYSNLMSSKSFDNQVSQTDAGYNFYNNAIRELPKLSDDERYKLLIKAKSGDVVSRKKFIESNLKLVFLIARNYSQCADFSDLIQSGNVGLVEAYEKFDINKGYKFSTYATYWIKREIIMFLNSIHPVKISSSIYFMIRKIKKAELELTDSGLPVTSENISTKTGISVSKINYLRNVPMLVDSMDATIADDDTTTVGDMVSSDINVEYDVLSRINYDLVYDIVMNMISDNFINNREARILLMRNGFINNRIYTYDELSNEFGVTRQRVEQIYKKVLMKIRNSKYKLKLAGCLDDESLINKILNR